MTEHILSKVPPQQSDRLRRSNGRPKPLHALTGSRFLAAIGVVAFHANYTLGASRGTPAAERIWGPGSIITFTVDSLSGLGSLGVNFFFILSGYILAYNYVGEKGLNGTLQSFYLARFARIYPLYILALGTVLLLRLLTGSLCTNHFCERGDNPLSAAASATLLQGWLPWFSDAFNGPGWTLSAEAFFYACFPAVIFLTRRIKSRKTMMTALAGAYIATQIGVTLAMASSLGGPGVQEDLGVLGQYSPLVRLPEFILGVLASIWVSRFGIPSWMRAVTVDIALLIAIPSLVLLGMLYLRVGGIALAVNNGLFDPLFIMLIFLLTSDVGLVNRALSGKVLQTLGESSYALYILHIPLWLWLHASLPVKVTSNPYFAILLFPIIAVLLALAAWHTIEKPSRRAILSRSRH